jgi:hypothetical protein
MTKLKVTILIGISCVLLLVIAFGVLRSQCPSAADRANAIKLEDVEKMAKGYERVKRLSGLGRQLEAAPSSERDRIIDAMINELDSDTQTRIRALPTRGERLDAIRDAIRIENEKETEASMATTKAMQPHFWCR